MLTEAIYNGMSKRKLYASRRGFSVTSISPCPYETYLNYTDKQQPSEHLPAYLSDFAMDDGHYQEDASLAWLRMGGFTLLYVGEQQLTIHVGKMLVPGHPDGIILTPRADLLELKAMNYDRFSKIRRSGLAEHPHIKCQVQSYMHSKEFRMLGINHAQILCKHKESSKLCDFQEDYDPAWIGPIIDATDLIVSGKLIPEPRETELCADCYEYARCWSSDRIAPETALTMSIPELEAQYAQGDELYTQGEYLKEEARAKMIELLGEHWSLLLDNYKVSRIEYKKAVFNQDSFVDLYGADNLGKVMEVKPVTQFRINKRS